jgi:hypothetical protein
MNGCFSGCLGRLLLLLLLAVGAVFAWRWGPDLRERWEERAAGGPSEEAEPVTPEVAVLAVARLSDLVEGGGGQEVSLSAGEVESLLRYSWDAYLPAGVTQPTLRFREGEVLLSVQVARDQLPAVPELENLRGLLPDPLPVQVRGRVLSLEGSEAGFLIHRIDAAGIPIPRALFPRFLEPLGSGGRPDLPPEAIVVPLPPGVRSVGLEGDRMVVRRRD